MAGSGPSAWPGRRLACDAGSVYEAETIAPGVVQADRWWYPERSGEAPDLYGFWETNINVCTADAQESCDPVIGSWPLRGLPCRLLKVEGETTDGL